MQRRSVAYTEFHPRWYRPRISTYWWLWRWPYLKFVLREISSVFVALYVLTTLLQIRALAGGPRAYAEFQQALKNPFLVLLHALVLFFVVFHAVTWFNLAPRAIFVRLGGKRVPDAWIAGANYAAWLGLTAILAWIILRGARG